MMRIYAAKAKIPGIWGWNKFNNVVSDGIEGMFQFLILEDQTYIRFPLNAMVVFSKERHYAILEKMERESGQKIISN